ncbi:helix-turn-helix domain-containing protein [Paenibacillus nasutitermitis]|uniref:AraC family transcriptional regulator n=1 Tax=Paenibacillus nasutitermitis TaxID=1652958 RepID=A0A916Z673_9BACL|nr:helix-turn-helix domain-containing protein [Paenibacillus nasutitermitis]GGD78559.1 AraC family transcriptional regulator [Paenibacillus nasutitermitis]
MLNVLLVDDEALALTHLRRIIDWEKHGFQLCGEAHGGQEAVEMIESLMPQIVIADIDMAGMDGVALSRYVHERCGGRIKLVMLSSYDNYEYVRETMKNGAADYLLKHRLEADGLLELLNRLKEDIRMSEAMPQGLAFMERNWSSLNQGLAQTYLRSLVLGLEIDTARAEEYFRHLSPLGVGRMVVTVLQVSTLPDPLGQRAPAETAQRSKAVLDVMRQCVDQGERGIAADVGEGRYVLLFSFPDERSEHAIGQRVRACLKRLADMLRLYVNASLSYGIGPVSSRFDRLAADYKTALLSMGGVQPREALPQAVGPATGVTLRQEKALIAAVEQAGASGCAIIVDEIFASLQGPHLKHTLPHTVNELIQLADKIWFKSGRQADAYYAGEWPTRVELADPDKLAATAVWVKSLYAQLMDKLAAGERHYSPYVQQAIVLIRSRFAEPISLEQASEQAGITDTYMGRLFRQETGTYFTDYLNRVRIEAAKQLIASGSYRVKQIYERVGFSSYTYFFKVFKSNVGMTPQEYAKSGP